MDEPKTPQTSHDFTGNDTLPPSPSTRPGVTAPPRHVCTLRTVHPPRSGLRRESWHLYDLEFDGEVIASGSITPEFDACRVLLARGLTGKLDLYDAVTKKLRYTVDIEKGAKLTVAETRSRGPMFAKWRPFDADRVRPAWPLDHWSY